MASRYDNLRWDDLVRQAQADHQQQWGAKDSFDPFSGGYTDIGGLPAQIYLDTLTKGNQQVGMWDRPSFNLKDPSYVAPDGTTDWMQALTRSADGGVSATPYKIDKAFPKEALAILAMAAGGMG